MWLSWCRRRHIKSSLGRCMPRRAASTSNRMQAIKQSIPLPTALTCQVNDLAYVAYPALSAILMGSSHEIKTLDGR